MPQRSRRSTALRAAVVTLLALAASAFSAPAGPPAAHAGPADQDPRLLAAAKPSAFAPALKRLEQQLLLEGTHERLERARALARWNRRHPGAAARSGARARPPGDLGEGGGPQGEGGRPQGADAAVLRARAATPARAGQALQANVLVNDRSQDAAFVNVGQAEQSIAAQGSNILVAWNDGLGFTVTPNTDSQGYGYSVDGGVTYVDGGVPPKLAGWVWKSDPVVTVDEQTGDFWYCGLVSVNSTQNGIAVARARFSAGTIQWSTPKLVRVASNSTLLFDKPWFVADSLSGRLYLSYTVFSATGDTIVFQRSSATNPLTDWNNPVTISLAGESNLVQGSRPAVGPNGEVYVVYYLIEQNSPYADHFRIRRSTDQGASFSAAVTAASLYSNYGSGAPGFNRGVGITYPSIAVDRSHGAHRGRVYLAWNESIDFYDDPLGDAGDVSEVEANGTAASANTFTVGKTVRGTLPTDSDFDWYKFNGNAGQTVVFFTDSIAATLSMSLRLFGPDGTSRLSLSAPGLGRNNLVVYTLPVSGTYYMRCVAWDPGTTGAYRIRTGFDVATPGERARDHRDVFVAWSDNGTAWSTPALASDSPAGYDDWLPEVAVGGDNADPRIGDGKPYCVWYDWRTSAATFGGTSNVRLSRSDDGGGSWIDVGTVTDAETYWTSVGSIIAPNQGDYLSLFVNGTNLYTAWADGRNFDPDIYAVNLPLVTTPVEVALASAEAAPDRVTLTWYDGGHPDLAATVERRETTTGFATVGAVSADGNGDLTFVDTAVTPGGRYAYRLSWLEGATQRTTPEVWVDVPVAAVFALRGAQPNPAVGEVVVALSLPDAAPATLELLDVAGRRLGERQVAGAGPHRVSISEGLALEPGVYLVRLTRAGRSLTTRVTVVR